MALMKLTEGTVVFATGKDSSTEDSIAEIPQRRAIAVTIKAANTMATFAESDKGSRRLMESPRFLNQSLMRGHAVSPSQSTNESQRWTESRNSPYEMRTTIRIRRIVPGATKESPTLLKIVIHSLTPTFTKINPTERGRRMLELLYYLFNAIILFACGVSVGTLVAGDLCGDDGLAAIGSIASIITGIVGFVVSVARIVYVLR